MQRKDNDGQGIPAREINRIVGSPCDRGKPDAIEECLNKQPARPESGWRQGLLKNGHLNAIVMLFLRGIQRPSRAEPKGRQPAAPAAHLRILGTPTPRL